MAITKTDTAILVLARFSCQFEEIEAFETSYCAYILRDCLSFSVNSYNNCKEVPKSVFSFLFISLSNYYLLKNLWFSFLFIRVGGETEKKS